ncbi:FCD domain-containing protein [Bradyrhizobium sp. 31Argb]|uniref:FCD domain-containing protein n=1 Tax=Bradyrhizobium sp. 31Argb TaxID=3141247 RepID=UPI00374A00AD
MHRTAHPCFNELDAIFDRVDARLKVSDIIGWALEDERFHLKIVELAGNRRLCETVSTAGARLIDTELA